MSDRLRAATDFIVIHTSATRYGSSVSPDDFMRWHIRDNGWDLVGYAVVIFPDGDIWYPHNYNKEHHLMLYRNHVKGFNDRAIGVCLVGGLDRATGKPSNQYTSIQMITLKKTIEELLAAFPHAKVTGHRTLSPDLDNDGVIETNEFLKECPCFNAPSWARYYGFPSHGVENTKNWQPDDNGLEPEKVEQVWSYDNSNSVFKHGIYKFMLVSKWSAQQAVKILNEYEVSLQDKA